MIELVPAANKNHVHEAFLQMKDDPFPMAIETYNAMSGVIHSGEDPDMAAAIFNGMMLGINLHYGLGRSSNLADRLNKYIVDKRRTRGEHVISFLDEKIRRNK